MVAPIIVHAKKRGRLPRNRQQYHAVDRRNASLAAKGVMVAAKAEGNMEVNNPHTVIEEINNKSKENLAYL